MRKLRSIGTQAGTVAALAAMALLTGTPSACAASCARIDTTVDMLSEQEQKAALLLFEEALRNEGRVLDPAGCAEEWVVSHVRLGDSLIVVVASPHGRRSDRVAGLEELPALYSQSVRALLTGRDPRDEVAGVVDRTNVTSAQVEARRVPSESMFIVRLGYGYASGPGNGGGPSVGLGWRRELNRVALDLAFANLLVLSDKNDDAYSSDPLNGGAFTPVALGVNYHFRPLANGTPYLGLGLGFTVWDPDGEASKGLDVRLNVGYEMFRASTLRLFVQADAILPTYEVTRRNWANGQRYDEDRFWPGTATVSLGVGFGGGRNDEDD
jgi:hypothetical protein